MAIKITGLRAEGSRTALDIPAGAEWSATVSCRACGLSQSASGTGGATVLARCPRCGSDEIDLRDVGIRGEP